MCRFHVAQGATSSKNSRQTAKQAVPVVQKCLISEVLDQIRSRRFQRRATNGRGSRSHRCSAISLSRQRRQHSSRVVGLLRGKQMWFCPAREVLTNRVHASGPDPNLAVRPLLLRGLNTHVGAVGLIKVPVNHPQSAIFFPHPSLPSLFSTQQ